MNIIINLDKRDKKGDPTVTVTPKEENRDTRAVRYIRLEYIENGSTRVLGRIRMEPIYRSRKES